MLERIKKYLEDRLEQPVSNKDMLMALEDAKNNITCNRLLLGKDVTFRDFLKTLEDTTSVRLKQNERRRL